MAIFFSFASVLAVEGPENDRICVKVYHFGLMGVDSIRLGIWTDDARGKLWKMPRFQHIFWTADKLKNTGTLNNQTLPLNDWKFRWMSKKTTAE